MIWISDEWKDYEVLDASDGERLERWGKYLLVRPDPQIIWNTPHSAPEWKKYDARYIRSATGGGRWSDHDLPERWQIRYKDYLTFNVKPMNFKHTGVFPEQAANWDFIREKVISAKRPVRVLNLFAYSGGATLAETLLCDEFLEGLFGGDLQASVHIYHEVTQAREVCEFDSLLYGTLVLPSENNSLDKLYHTTIYFLMSGEPRTSV